MYIKNMYYVYILYSKKDGQLYTGCTPNLRSRIKKHFNGFVTSTKYRLPLQLIYYEAYQSDTDARKREIYLKGGKGKKELKRHLKDTYQCIER